MKTKIMQLRNMYTGEVVFTESFDKVEQTNGVNFIEVYNKNNPFRKYFVNRDAFTVVKDK